MNYSVLNSKVNNLLILVVLLLSALSLSCGEDKIVDAKDVIPILSITNPVYYQKVYDPMNVTVEVSGAIKFTKITLVVDSTKSGSDSTEPYAIFWEPHKYATNTTHQLWVYGLTEGGDYYASNVVICIVDTIAAYPNAVQIQGISNVTDSSVELTWGKSIDTDFSKYVIQYSQSNASSSFIDYETIRDINDTSTVITNLDENKKYYFRLVVGDYQNHLTISSNKTTTTTNRVPDPVVYSDTTRDTSVIAISWSPSTQVDFKAYHVFRSTDSSLSINDILVATYNNRYDTSFSETLSGDSTDYYYFVEVEDNGGLKASSIYYFAKFEISHSIQIVSPTNNSHQYDLVHIVVETDMNYTYNSISLYNGNNLISTDFDAPWEFDYDFIQFENGTQQQLHVVATYNTNLTYSSDAIILIVDESLGIPNQVDVYPITTITDSSIEVYWSQSDITDFGKYVLITSKVDSLINSNQIVDIPNQTDTFYTVTGLDENQQYNFFVEVHDQQGLFSMSTGKSGKTLNRVPPPVQIESYFRDTADLELSWHASNIKDFGQYNVYKSSDSILSGDDQLQQVKNILTDTVFYENVLTDSSEFYFIVEVVDTAGLSGYSSYYAKFFPTNYALSFSGLQYATVPYYSALDIGEQFTFEALVYQTGSVSGDRIIDKSLSAGNPGFQYSLFSDSHFGITLCNDSTQLGSIHHSGNKISFNTWQHIAVTYDNGHILFYKNGQFISEKTIAPQILCTNNTPLSIGRKILNDEMYFQGIIDEIRIWNIVRTSQEIAENWQKYLQGSEFGLVLYMDFNEGDGQILINKAGTDGVLGADSGVDSKDPVRVVSDFNLSQ